MSAMSELDAAVNWAAQYSATFSQQTATISELRCALAERDELIAAQADTIAALRIEVHVLRQRYGLTPESAARMLGAVMDGAE